MLSPSSLKTFVKMGPALVLFNRAPFTRGLLAGVKRVFSTVRQIIE